MKHQSKFSQEQQHTAAHQSQQQAGHQFSSAEEMLRHNAKQTPIPPEIAERLKQSLGMIPPAPRRSWWNLFRP